MAVAVAAAVTITAAVRFLFGFIRQNLYILLFAFFVVVGILVLKLSCCIAVVVVDFTTYVRSKCQCLQNMPQFMGVLRKK